MNKHNMDTTKVNTINPNIYLVYCIIVFSSFWFYELHYGNYDYGDETNSLFIFVTSIFSPAGTAKNNFLILASSRNRTV